MSCLFFLPLFSKLLTFSKKLSLYLHCMGVWPLGCIPQIYASVNYIQLTGKRAYFKLF